MKDVSSVQSESNRWGWAVTFFVVTYLVTAVLWLPVLLSGQPLSDLSRRLQLLVVLASLVPSLTAMILASIEGGRRGLLELLS
jgi:hypothetical protein